MANDITFIIGNGLDLSLGLKTAYKDFYSYIRDKRQGNRNRIYKQIQDSPETWADFETQLGKYTFYIEKLPEKDRKKESVNLHEELEEFRDDLAEYLAQQENSIENLADNYTFSIGGSGFFDELPAGQVPRILTLANGRPTINFITLNYTSALEKIISDYNSIRQLPYDFNTIPLHVHGSLEENLTFGVSDDTQLFSGMSTDERDDLIKPKSIVLMNDNRIQEMRQTINNSSLLVLFGTSIGITDRYIWDYVIEWLSLNTNRYIVMHKYDETYIANIRRSPRRQRQYTNNVQNRLLNYSDKDNDERDRLKNRIFVVHNTKQLFVPRPSPSSIK